jgi:hypothetical protein
MDPIVFFWLLAGPIVGVIIGSRRNCMLFGFLVGLLLGPLGWVLALLSDNRQKCPDCLGRLPDGARRCQHCGVLLEAPAGATPPPIPSNPQPGMSQSDPKSPE